MNFDIVFAGVGGQGVLSLAGIIAKSAADEGLFVKQSEVHGMSQRGGAVFASLRISDQPIESPLVPKGTANLLVSVEPVESLRYLAYLAPNGTIVTSSSPHKNIQNYPELDGLLGQIRSIPGAVLVQNDEIARVATGTLKVANTVMVGAASCFLPLKTETLENTIRLAFARKGDEIVESNLKAFRAGREAVKK